MHRIALTLAVGLAVGGAVAVAQDHPGGEHPSQ